MNIIDEKQVLWNGLEIWNIEVLALIGAAKPQKYHELLKKDFPDAMQHEEEA